MKKMKFVIATEGLNLEGPDMLKTPQQLIASIIKNVILNASLSKQQRGLTEDERRIFYKISDEFEKAISLKADYIELEDAWYDMIKMAFKEARLLPYELLRRVEDLIGEGKNK